MADYSLVIVILDYQFYQEPASWKIIFEKSRNFQKFLAEWN